MKTASGIRRTALAAAALLVLAAALPRGAPAQGSRHADPALEALLPQTLGGVALTVESQAGPDLSTRSAAFDAFLTGLGKTREDFVVASAYPLGGLPAAVSAWRVRGAPTDRLLPAFRATLQASSATPLGGGQEDIGGRSVMRIGDPGQLAQGPIYVIARDDTLFFAQTKTPALAAEAVSKLPR